MVSKVCPRSPQANTTMRLKTMQERRREINTFTSLAFSRQNVAQISNLSCKRWWMDTRFWLLPAFLLRQTFKKNGPVLKLRIRGATSCSTMTSQKCVFNQPFSPLPHLCCTAASLQTCWGECKPGCVWEKAFKHTQNKLVQQFLCLAVLLGRRLKMPTATAEWI